MERLNVINVIAAIMSLLAIHLNICIISESYLNFFRKIVTSIIVFIEKPKFKKGNIILLEHEYGRIVYEVEGIYRHKYDDSLCYELENVQNGAKERRSCNITDKMSTLITKQSPWFILYATNKKG